MFGMTLSVMAKNEIFVPEWQANVAHLVLLFIIHETQKVQENEYPKFYIKLVSLFLFPKLQTLRVQWLVKSQKFYRVKNTIL